jgi:3-dehydroquinate synthase
VIELRCSPAEGRPTRVRIADGLLLGPNPIATVAGSDAGRRIHALVDRRVAALHPGLVAGLDGVLLVDGGEELKSFAGLEAVLRHLAGRGAERRDVLAAVGGGSVGDLGGLAAALHLRGIELRMVPTTLLAMVDSSVGGKTAINLPEGKNLVGAFWPASEVLIDPGTVATLPDAEWRSGLGEVLKVALGLDAALFEFCEREAASLLDRAPRTVARAVELALRAKIRLVEVDPFERGARRLLNLGHTLGHALEAWSGFSIPHGVAVARGLHHAVDLGERFGGLASTEATRARNLLRRFGFEATALPPRGALLGFLGRDKKVEGGLVHAVLPTAIGASATRPFRPEDFLPAG